MERANVYECTFNVRPIPVLPFARFIVWMASVLYKTLSVCSPCALVEQKGVKRLPATVECEGTQVWLVVE